MERFTLCDNVLSLFDNDIIKCFIEYKVNNFIEIVNVSLDSDEALEKTLNKLIAITYFHHKNYCTKNSILSKHHFIYDGSMYVLLFNSIRIKRFCKIGDGLTGPKNNICDVDGVRVGHFTVNDDCYNTGITVISPHNGNIYKEKVVASSYVFNGFGKSTGLVQIEELGSIETNIVLTSTLNVGKVLEAVVGHAVDQNIEIGETTGTVNGVVLECNDGDLNKSRERILGRKSYKDALEDLNYDFMQGAIGAGAGMICHGFKGGIGSSSRQIELDGKVYTIGVLVNSNFGESNGKSLIFKGHFLGNSITKYLEETEDKGSIVVAFATDLPLNCRQLKRVLKRCEIGIGRTGSYAGNGSGDLFVGFSTRNKIKHFTKNAIDCIERLSDNCINIVFKKTVEATEEAVLNSMLFSNHVKGYKKEVKSLCEVAKIFVNYLDEEVIYEI